MARDTKAQMIRGAAELLAEKGVQGASFSEVLERTGAPRGSIYHHFPDGKTQLVGAAVQQVGDAVVGLIDVLDADEPGDVIDAFVDGWRAVLLGSDFHRGCAVAAVSVDAGDDELRSIAAEVFGAWTDALTRALVRAGARRAQARDVATLALVSVEGALLVGRATQDPAPFDVVARRLRQLLQA